MTHRPYLQITLSTRPLGLEKNQNVTCQHALRKRGRSGKTKGEKQHSEKKAAGIEGTAQKRKSTSAAEGNAKRHKHAKDGSSDAK